MKVLKIIVIVLCIAGCKDSYNEDVPVTNGITPLVTNVNTSENNSEKQIDDETTKVNQSDTHLKKYSISNTNEKKFEEWKHGNASIFLVTQPYKRNNKEEVKVGEVQEDGSFDFKLPASVNLDRSISNYFKCEGTASAAQTDYKTPKTSLISAYFSIRKNENEIGLLSLATSRQQIYNNSPFGKYHGHLGYRLQLWYAQANTGAYAVCKRNIEATNNAEVTKQIDITDVYDLSFSQGWNYVKTEIKENQLVGNVPYYKAKKYTVEPSLPNDVRWVFKEH
ncbi:MAG TPA: hypothetical protein DEG69_05985 [Flavobacteriaceae bacterium]|jgi:hypothetical protein|nr:hypothetical protein [Flavobacteriaceae bacterium]|tara:strand:- start:258672 stop:259508 length:837 start_codon:yes stop_codon:yes gene_type:complete